ncbi:hypothetical protein GCM10017779_06300 [Streptomyces capillispiralis]|nr:hypothetical protein GCM10017779_06300 [Streptomyces capillispiralis]
MWVSPAVLGYGPDAASKVVRAAEPFPALSAPFRAGDPHREVVTGGGANRENLP